MLGYFSLYQLNFLFSLSPRLLSGELLALNDISLCKRLSPASLPTEWELASGAGCVQGGGGRCWALGFRGSSMGLQDIVYISGSAGTPQLFLHTQCNPRVFAGIG